MTPFWILTCLVGYFLVLILISEFTKDKTGDSFFDGNKNSPWYIVAFGMIGASLSGVTFISVPGWVQSSHFSYFSVCLGYVLGYLVISFILLPTYYKLSSVSIYQYLETRFGRAAHKTGAVYFLISRVIGAAFRLYLVASVLQLSLFSQYGIPFEVTVVITIALIWVYTFRGGIKTVVWTDTLQTLFMLLSAGITVYWIADDLQLGFSALIDTVKDSPYSSVTDEGNFWLGLVNGAFITIVMTGLDQDMMQKNLTIKTLPDAQKNMVSFSFVLVFVNLLFLSLGALLYIYAEKEGIVLPEKADMMFPYLAFNYFGPAIGILFILGLTAAAYSSADSALTALTTSYCVDILGKPHIDKKQRNLVHLGFSLLILVVIIVFRQINNDSVISDLFKAAGYTYGPLLGLFTLGLFSSIKLKDKMIPMVAILAPVLTYLTQELIANQTGYKMGFEVLLVNGVITIIGLFLIAEKK